MEKPVSKFSGSLCDWRVYLNLINLGYQLCELVSKALAIISTYDCRKEGDFSKYVYENITLYLVLTTFLKLMPGTLQNSVTLKRNSLLLLIFLGSLFM